MNVKSVKILDGKLLLIGEDQEFYLMDGVYRGDDGGTITVRGHQIVNVLTVPDLKVASKEQLENFLADLEQQLSTVGDDAQLANIDLQSSLQKQQQTLQTMSNVSKMLHDTAMAIIRKIG
jgi:hypothetical protein